jgi:dTDP-glucose pyrophosphorylase
MHKSSLINVNSSLIDVLKKLDRLPTTQTVFVVNDNKKVIGTITDGDIRRGLIKGLNLESSLDKFVFRNFKFLRINENNFDKLREFRRLKLKVVPLLNNEGQLLKIYDFSVLKSIIPVDAVLMAGGKGERLKPLTIDTPKPLLKVGNKEIIAYNFDRLHQFGIFNQHITINYLGDQITNFCKDYNNEIDFNLVQEDQFLGTAGGLSLIKEFKNDVILLMNSDLLTNIDYEDFYISFINKQADMMVASIPYKVDLPYAILDTENRIINSFKEKPSYTYYANAGIYLLKKHILNYIPSNTIFNATDLMETVKNNGDHLLHYPIRSYWLDIGKHEDYEKAQMDVAHINFD